MLISFEGGEGSGKSTQMGRLAARLRSGGRDVLETREPGGTPLAERARGILLDPGEPLTPWSEAFLMLAARADLVARVIGPALERGAVVLCDRYADSTLAYQGGGRGLDAALLASMNAAATGGRRPDLTLLFDVDPRLGLARRGGAGEPANRLDRESAEFHERVRARYLELARAEPARWVVLDATRPPAEVESRVWDEVQRHLDPVL